MATRLSILFPAIFLPFLLSACEKPGSAETNSGCEAPLVAGTSICLEFGPSSRLSSFRAQITEISREALMAIRAVMPIDDLTIQVQDAPGNTIPEIGLGGYNPDSHTVILSVNPGFPNLAAVLEKELPYQLAHEIHHARRRRSVGYGASLGEALISEGLADHFAMEVTGNPPPAWTTALEGDELEVWMEQALSGWKMQPYDHRAWFVGTGDIPRWAGYSIGYRLVSQYLASHPGERASGLFGKKAGVFR